MRAPLALVVVIALAAPAVADAETWRGKTSQKRAVMVRTGGNDLVKRVRIAWRARCEKGRYTSTTLFVPPFDTSTKAAFADKGSYDVDIPGGYRAHHTATVSATLDAKDVWRGTFEVRTRVTTRTGKFVDRCRLRPVKWSARSDA